MYFIPSELIRKKRFGGEHTQEELHFLVQSFAEGRLPDYQMASWLMAVCFRGMTPRETAWLTQEMRDSGVVLNLGRLGTTVDKHSTGGVGDKTSLILAPLVAAAGVPVPMMAGRGLGHTGGTLDKLESIPEFNVWLEFSQFEQQVADLGCAIIGQTKEICPADGKMYALRDVTGTIESLPLICASIMSKKLAEGMSALVLDVKYGSGAFMKTLEDAESLARALADIARQSGKRVVALLTSMNEPLGRFIGNGLEVRECLEIMEGKRGHGEGKDYQDTIQLTLELAAHMIVLGGKAKDLDEARRLAEKRLTDGSARQKFADLCRRQGGDLQRLQAESRLQEKVYAETDGFIHYLDVEKIGLAGIHLNAGRKIRSDVLDYGAGIEVFRRQGDLVKKGDLLFCLHHAEFSQIPPALKELKAAYAITTEHQRPKPLIAKVLS
jgi:pyrimidine-nucleoside phosphorylase